MPVAGFNDDEDELEALAGVLERVDPDEIQVVLPTRPSTLSSIHPASADAVALAVRIQSPVAAVSVGSETQDTSAHGSNLLEILVGVAQRHPIAEAELARVLPKWQPAEITDTLETLIDSGLILAVERCGRRFYSSAKAHYPDSVSRDGECAPSSGPCPITGPRGSRSHGQRLHFGVPKPLGHDDCVVCEARFGREGYEQTRVNCPEEG